MNHRKLERRSSERFVFDLKGQVAPQGNSYPVECRMLDLSTTGARLEFFGAAEIPLEFELQIPKKEAVAQVRLVWTMGRECGVVFTD